MPGPARWPEAETRMADEVLLYDLTDSPFCMKARICLQLKGVPFRRVTLTVRRLRELRRLNPLGKVPVLVSDDEVVADSSAIARWLEVRHPEPPLLPADPAARAYCDLIEEWADEALYFVVGGFKWLNPANRAAALANTMDELGGGPLRPLVGRLLARNVQRRYRAWGYGPESLALLEQRMRDNLGTLETLLDQRAFLLGRQGTVADIAAFAQLAWMRGYAEGRLLDDVPRVARWLERMEENPAVAAALAA
jgi:glutathione S-transferase